MFGYVKPHIPELKVKEHELYKAVYCGLCFALGKSTGQLSRFTLSYDIVFLALVRCCATAEEIHIEKGRCVAHPIKTRNHAFMPETLEYCAKVSAILSYFKAYDNKKDSKSLSALKSSVALAFAKGFYSKAKMEELEADVKKELDSLDSLEKDDGSLDKNAECFGRLLAEVFAFDINNPSISRHLYDLGYHVGKWIYIIDAADDFEEDRKKGEYNPLSSFDILPREMLNVACHLELKAAHDAFGKIETDNIPVQSIINNILTLGMTEVTEKITGDKK